MDGIRVSSPTREPAGASTRIGVAVSVMLAPSRV
jgi:hypothetical protein